MPVFEELERERQLSTLKQNVPLVQRCTNGQKNSRSDDQAAKLLGVSGRSVAGAWRQMPLKKLSHIQCMVTIVYNSNFATVSDDNKLTITH